MTTIDLDALQEAVGRRKTAEDVVTRASLQGLWATLDRDPGEIGETHPLPPLAHWLFCRDVAPQGQLGEDGHLARGRFLPPLPYPRRMWAGSRVGIDGEILVGDRIQRTSTIVSIDHKEGRRGPLLLITIEHRTEALRGDILEEQDLVYLELPTEPTVYAPDPEPVLDADTAEEILPTSSMLFRFSALTFNAHRIHYDRDYTRDAEHYPDLVVHGPLTAMLLADYACRHHEGRLSGFAFRARRPMFVDRPISLHGALEGSEMSLRALDDTHSLGMAARAEFTAR